MYDDMLNITTDTTGRRNYCNEVPFGKLSRSKGLPFDVLAELEHMSH
jgi:hypothetical protein